jgi:hypothetical protein
MKLIVISLKKVSKPKMNLLQTLSIFLLPFLVLSQENTITKWKTSTGTGYSGITADVTKVYYDSSFVYVSANSIPSYTIGPNWLKNPNTPGAQDYTFKFLRTPRAQTGTKRTVGLGTIGLWIDGVAMYNADDGQRYNTVWRRNAYLWEGESFDSCKGHADSSKRYHNHVNPVCLYNSTDSSKHSPLIGFMFDSYPIYGPFGYASANNSASGIKRMTSSYRTRNISSRTSLANGTVLSSDYYGPSLSTYSLGYYLEDFEYVSGLGDLDQYNGRWCVTPEYPSGTYAYFISTDSTNSPVYPYNIGLQYYGVVASTQKTTIPSTASKYFSI